jgi:hypothetical protein
VIDRKDLVDAVLESRDSLDPDLETALLEAIVDAEAGATGNAEAAIRAVDEAISAAVERGVGSTEEPNSLTDVGNLEENDG